MAKCYLMLKKIYSYLLLKDCGGFTLVELAVVLAIIAIAGTVIAVGPGFLTGEKGKSVSRELLADLQWIRHAAVTQGPDEMAPQLRGFGIRMESNRAYRLFRFNDSNSNFQYDGTGEEAPLRSEISIRQRLVSQPLELKIKSKGKLVDPQDTILIFDHLGIPRQANLGFQQMSIVIQAPNISSIPEKCISISFNRIREGLWDGNECIEQ
jgi:prepilin-type N-terminal cleavage/methylation domain-containing protein